jgi:hypothetical protein
MRESSPEAEAMEWLEPVACEIGEWLADRQSVPSASPVSALAGGDGTKRGADNPAPMSPGKDTLPVASDVTATTAEATTVPAAALPWPVFSAPEPVAETATEIVQETTVPWPVFAPAGTNGGPVGAVALNTSRPCEASDLAGLSSPREVASDSPVVRDGQPFRPTGRVASILPENPRDQSAACAQPVWGDAVRLTRQAVSAWVNVLTRPTRVEITAR